MEGRSRAGSATRSTTPSRADGYLERHPNRMRALHDGAHEPSGAQDDSCASQADHALRAMVRRDGVAVATNTGAGEQHDGIESLRRIEPQPHLVEVSLRRPQPRVGPKRSSVPRNQRIGMRFPHPALLPRARPATVRIVRACVRYASSVQYQGVTCAMHSASGTACHQPPTYGLRRCARCDAVF